MEAIVRTQSFAPDFFDVTNAWEAGLTIYINGTAMNKNKLCRQHGDPSMSKLSITEVLSRFFFHCDTLIEFR